MAGANKAGIIDTDYVPKRTISIALMPALDEELSDYLTGNALLVNERMLREDYFTSRIFRTFEESVCDTRGSYEQITRDIPNASGKALSHLDECGIAKVGAYVKKGDILIGKTSEKDSSHMTPEEKMLYSLFGRNMAIDDSLVMPYMDGGVVIKANYALRNERHDSIKSASVWVAIKKRLGIGDVLQDDAGNCGVVARFFTYLPICGVDEEIDIVAGSSSSLSAKIIDGIPKTVWRVGEESDLYVCSRDIKTPKQLAEVHGKYGKEKCELVGEAKIGYIRLTKRTELSEKKITVRETGPYSLYRQQPLSVDIGTGYGNPARFTENEVSALQNYPALVKDALTIRSDAVRTRYDAIKAVIADGKY